MAYPFRSLLLVAALVATTPAPFLLTGCGGGSSNSVPSVRLFSSTVELNSTQTAFVRVRLRGAALEGTMTVSTRMGQSGPIRDGEYALAGTFVPPAGFLLEGDIPGTGRVSLTGQLPIDGGSGAFTLSVGGTTVGGTFTRS